jgi:hypothetical protein
MATARCCNAVRSGVLEWSCQLYVCMAPRPLLDGQLACLPACLPCGRGCSSCIALAPVGVGVCLFSLPGVSSRHGGTQCQFALLVASEASCKSSPQSCLLAERRTHHMAHDHLFAFGQTNMRRRNTGLGCVAMGRWDHTTATRLHRMQVHR